MDADRRLPVTPPRVGPWLAELGLSARGLASAYLPIRRAISSRSRQQVVLAVTEVNGCRYTAWVHGAWSEFLGEDAADDGLEALLDYARESAQAGAPVSTARLDGVLPAEAVQAVRATVAVAEVSTLVGQRADELADGLRGRTPVAPAVLLRDAVLVAAAVPVAAPLFALAGAMRVVTRLSPPMPAVVQPADEEANLVVAMLAEAVPAALSHALVRALLLVVPRPMVVGVRAEGSAATIRITRDRIRLENGLADDTSVVVDGGLDLLVDLAGRALSRDLERLTVR